MKYIKMFDNLDNIKVGKPTKVRYERMREFIKTKELADRLDKLKVPNWWVMTFIEWNIWDIHFVDRKITHKQKLDFFKSFLFEKVETKIGGREFLWKLMYFETTSRIHKFKNSTVTKEEKILQESRRKVAREKYEKENAEFRKKHGNIFGNFFGGIFDIDKHYKTLEIEKGATQQEIKKAYRNMSKKYHPDVGGTNEKFNEINTAYRALYK